MTSQLDLTKELDTKLKNSFSRIKKDLKEIQNSVDKIQTRIKEKDKFYNQESFSIKKSREQLQEQIDEFSNKTTQLKLALSQISAIKSEVVIKKDLNRIEERIKLSFKREVEKYKRETTKLRKELQESNKKIKSLEKGTVHKKKSWFKK